MDLAQESKGGREAGLKPRLAQHRGRNPGRQQVLPGQFATSLSLVGFPGTGVYKSLQDKARLPKYMRSGCRGAPWLLCCSWKGAEQTLGFLSPDLAGSNGTRPILVLNLALHLTGWVMLCVVLISSSLSFFQLIDWEK